MDDRIQMAKEEMIAQRETLVEEVAALRADVAVLKGYDLSHRTEDGAEEELYLDLSEPEEVSEEENGSWKKSVEVLEKERLNRKIDIRQLEMAPEERRTRGR
jgi:surfactin synthase thioesterase subunit